MEVLGKDKTHDGCRVAITIGDTDVVALVPDALLSQDYGQDTRVAHQQAHEWIATRRHDLTDAITALVKGTRPGAPFTHITLEGR